MENLLWRCAGLQPGGRLLILHEPAGLGYYSDSLPSAVAERARALGVETSLAQVPFSRRAQTPDAATTAAMQAADVTLFLARAGDQIRFGRALAGVRALVSYALDETMFASAFGTASYDGFLALKQALDAALRAAGDIRVRCPLGTDFSGRIGGEAEPEDVTVRRFPMLVHAPVPAAGFAGQIAQAGFLVGTGSHFYDPYGCPLDAPLTIAFDGNRITGLTGAEADVKRARAHYEHVSDLFGIDAGFVHSWHAGIHPGCAYPEPAGAGFERWSGSAFGNPRLLHVHTCGAYAPGEISLNVLDPTILLDGVAVWETGRLVPERIAGGAAILARHPDLRACFAAPARACGLGPEGRLSFA